MAKTKFQVSAIKVPVVKVPTMAKIAMTKPQKIPAMPKVKIPKFKTKTRTPAVKMPKTPDVQRQAYTGAREVEAMGNLERSLMGYGRDHAGGPRSKDD
jgi:hypothetical protein